MFPGGLGQNHFSERDGRIVLSQNFLVRTASLFAARGFLVAVIDTPSDLAQGMDDGFRMGKSHAEDVAKVLQALEARAPAPIYLAGTSRGTRSAASVAASIKDPRVKGLVLTSSMADSGRGRNRAAPSSTPTSSESGYPCWSCITRRTAVSPHPSEPPWRCPRLCRAAPRWISSRSRAEIRRAPSPARRWPLTAISGASANVVAVIADRIDGKPVPKQVP